MKKSLGFKNTEATEVNQLMVTGTLSSIVMTTGAAVFSEYEGWSYIDRDSKSVVKNHKQCYSY